MPALLPAGASATVGRHLTPEPERELPQDPVQFVRDELSEHPWSVQRKIMRSVVEHRKTAVPSSHGTGKSYTAARVACWWLEGHAPGDAFVVTSAPSDHQVGAILWREIRRAHAIGSLAGRTNLANEWYIGPAGAEELVAYGRKPQDLKDAKQAMQTFQGIHARYVLVILDESTGIPPWLWAATDTLVTNEASRVLAIGNPDDPASHFEQVCRPGSGWNVMHVSTFDTPNFTGEPVPEHLRELLPSKVWEEEMREAWGADHPHYIAKVLGQFADTSDDRVISPAMVKAAQLRELPGSERGAFGLDVARYGTDHSVLYRDRGGVVRFVAKWRKQSTAETRVAVMGITSKVPAVPVGVDADGLGGGVYDEMVLAGQKAVAFTAAGKVQQPRRFKNRRSELWWSYREEMEAGLIDLDPDDDELAAQLQQPKWDQNNARRLIRVETKEEMAARGVKSPDFADAAIIARFTALSPAGMGGAYAKNGASPEQKRPITSGLRRRQM